MAIVGNIADTPEKRTASAVTLHQVLDQSDLESVAEDLDVNSGICGYAAVALAAELSALPAPRTSAGLADLAARLSASALVTVRRSLPSAVGAVRSRRTVYARSNPAEFVPDGTPFRESLDGDDRPRQGLASYLRGLASVTDVLFLLGRTCPDVPLVRTVQVRWPRADGERETRGQITSSLSVEEDRAAVEAEGPFAAEAAGAALIGRTMAVGRTAVTPGLEEGSIVIVSGFSEADGTFSVQRAVVAAADAECAVQGVPAHALRPLFVEWASGRRCTLEDHIATSDWRLLPTCSPLVVDVGGHYDVAIPVELKDEGSDTLVVFETMSEPVCVQHEVLATILLRRHSFARLSSGLREVAPTQSSSST